MLLLCRAIIRPNVPNHVRYGWGAAGLSRKIMSFANIFCEDPVTRSDFGDVAQRQSARFARGRLGVQIPSSPTLIYLFIAHYYNGIYKKHSRFAPCFSGHPAGGSPILPWSNILEKRKELEAASLRSAASSYWILGKKISWRFCILRKENFLNLIGLI